MTEEEQEDVAAIVGLLEAKGPALSYPYCSKIKGSGFGQIRELRIQNKGKPYRICSRSRVQRLKGSEVQGYVLVPGLHFGGVFM